MLLKEKAGVVFVRLALQTLAGSVLLAASAHAQQASTSGSADQAADGANKAAPQKVYVTGSNVRRITLESASPVQVLTREEITRGGATSLNEVLRTISSNVGGIDENRTNGFTAGASGLNLRGVGSQATLTLINGRRLAPYAQPEFQTTFVDLNSIPIGAVERIEILKDGASAIYGSEAMAGVVNIILRSNYEGIELGGSVGQSSRNDGEQLRSTLSIGGGNLVKDHFNAYATIDLRSRKPMYLSKRDDYLSTQDTRAWGYKDARSLYTFPGNLYWTDKATGQYMARSIGGNCPAGRLVDFSTRVANGGGQSCVFDDYADGTFNAAGKTDRASITSRLTWQPNASTTVFSELMFNRNKVVLTGNLHWFAGQIGQPMPALPITHPQYPKDLIGADGNTLVGGNGSVRVRASLRDFPAQGQDNTTDFGRYLVGAKGDFKNWDWETALLLTNSKVTALGTSGMLVDPLLEAYQNGSFLFGSSASNADLYKRLMANSSSTFKSGLQQVDAKLSGELMTLPAGAVGLAVGVEARREFLDTNPDQLSIDGALYHAAQSPPGFSNSRRIASVFGEATIPLIKDVEAQLAARFDHYSDYGNSTTPKVGLKWTVSPALMLRGTYASGFRAPTLVENSTDVRNAYQSFTDPLRCNAQFKLGCNNGANSAYQSGANPALKPETAKSFTLGMAWEPSSSFLATLDVWQIKRIDEINTYSLDRVLADPSRYANDPAAQIIRDPLTAADRAAGAQAGEVSNIIMLLTNVAVTQVRGLDLKLQGKVNMGEYGTLTPTLNLSHTQSYKTAPTPDSELVEFAGTSDTPSVKATLGLAWKKAAYALSADTVFVSKTATVDDRSLACSLATEGYAQLCSGIASFTTFNLGASYTGFKDLKLSLAVQNAFDRKPPFTPGRTGNYNATLHSAMGRYIQVTADYQFK
ncbi:TonB-dependent receptor [Rugamonas sp. CCM 8940]|uniref:TonB-dependent receptor n=1 Tax=Rugamonas sp. CCM 8940 TaxID=2765359 RepID=UPI0018F6BE68|nr:TonB-dependent receptor [Rugamonas sp. CCM 8940]MBJ7313193.1 TonB-dependent receptor [Rugamonas sp. CCM 8940]